MRHYNAGGEQVRSLLYRAVTRAHMAGWCMLKRVESSVESAWFQRLKLTYNEPLSKFAFNLNLRPYNMMVVVGHCRLLTLRRTDPGLTPG